MISSMAAWLYGWEAMSPDMRDAMRKAWREYTPYRGDTENHWVMYYSALYLAAEQWPGEPGSAWFNGKSSRENLLDARGFLLDWARTTATIGQGEFDSPDYLPVYLNGMLLLHDFARDPRMRRLGGMMLDLLLADFAEDHLDGQYTGGFSRVYEPAVYTPMMAGTAGIARLLFGSHPAPLRHVQTEVLFALSSYRLPEIIRRIATERDKPFINRERKRVRNVIRFGTERNPPVFKYNYIAPDYAIGSLQGGILQPIQQHTWGLHLRSTRQHTVIFGLHPYWSAYELGMFFPEEIKALNADVVASKGTYNNPDKWTGSSPCERIFQYRNTLIALYDIPAGTNTEHIDGFFPRSLDTLIRDSSGWLIAREGNVFAGWLPLRPAALIPGEISTRLRSMERRNGYIVEVRSASEAGSFERFCALLKTRTADFAPDSGDVRVKYRTLDGASLSFSFRGKRSVNGKNFDPDPGKLFDSPFIHSALRSGRILLKAGTLRRILDFNSWRTTDR